MQKRGTWSEAYLVLGVVDHGGSPLALVGRVALRGRLPLAAAGGVLAQWVGDAWRLPLAILLLVPVLRLLGLYETRAGARVRQPGQVRPFGDFKVLPHAVLKLARWGGTPG